MKLESTGTEYSRWGLNYFIIAKHESKSNSRKLQIHNINASPIERTLNKRTTCYWLNDGNENAIKSASKNLLDSKRHIFSTKNIDTDMILLCYAKNSLNLTNRTFISKLHFRKTM